MKQKKNEEQLQDPILKKLEQIRKVNIQIHQIFKEGHANCGHIYTHEK